MIEVNATTTGGPGSTMLPSSTVTDLLPYVLRYKAQVAAGVVALAAASASLLAVPSFLGRLIDRADVAAPGSALEPPWWLALAIVVFAVATALRTYTVTWVGERVVSDIRSRIYGHVLTLPHQFFETRSTGELLSRLSNDVTALQSVISVVMVIGLRSTIQLAGAMGMMIATSWRLTLLVVVIGPVLGVVGKLAGKRVRGRAALNREREALVVAHIEESIDGIAMIKAFTAENRERDRFDRHVEECFGAAESLFRARAQFTALVVIVVLGSSAGVGVLGLHQVLAGDMTGGMLTQFLLYMSVASLAAIGLSDIHAETRKAAGATERLFALLRESPETPPSATLARLPAGRGAVDFLGVGFRYSSRPEVPVLEAFDLSLRPGEVVALVGPSGAGKTTLFRLLLRFISPRQGTIRIDGVDIAELDSTALRQEIGIVTQEPVIFTGTAMANIRYGRDEATDAEVIAAAELAQADGFISALPLGYLTPLGHKGHGLSAGQRQRLAIARAILRRPRLLLLDEASSFLDAESESALREVLMPFMRQRTSLVITHRPALARYADRIIVLDRGRIVAEGTHAELLTTSAFYRHLIGG